MSEAEFGIGWIRQLAKRLEADIHLRGLKEGDRYLTAAEAGQLLNCSTASAHRAMRILAERKLLMRYRSQGTFVGPSAGQSANARSIKTVYILLPAESTEVHEMRLDVLIRTLRSSVLNSNVQLSFVPKTDSIRYLVDIFALSHDSSEIAGVVAVSCPRDIYRFLVQKSVPVVVLGSLYPGDPPIASVDGDHREAGRLLTTYLIDKGHRRFSVLFPDVSRPGQNAFVDGISDVLTAAQLPFNAVIIRSIPHDDNTFSAAVRQLLEMSDRPTALIVRQERFADICSDVVDDLGLESPDDVEIVFREPSMRVPHSPYTHTQPQWSFEDVGTQVGRILCELSDRPTEVIAPLLIPMELLPADAPREFAHV